MKTLVYILFSTLFLISASCGSKKNSAESGIKITIYSNYFLKNNYKQEKAVDLIVLNDKVIFNNIFGIAKTMSNEIVSPDFDAEFVLAIAAEPTNIKTDIHLDKVQQKGSEILIYATILKGEEQSFSSNPLVIFSIPRDESIEKAQLYIDGNLVGTQILQTKE